MMRRRLLSWPSSLAGAVRQPRRGRRRAAAAPRRCKPPPGWQLAWSDEFDVDGLPDPKKWGNDTAFNKQGWFNHEQQYYSAPRAENAVVQRRPAADHRAQGDAVDRAPTGAASKYTSARLLTRGLAEWTYGFFEIRAKLPCGLGTWPAIWMLGSPRRLAGQRRAGHHGAHRPQPGPRA